MCVFFFENRVFRSNRPAMEQIDKWIGGRTDAGPPIKKTSAPRLSLDDFENLLIQDFQVTPHRHRCQLSTIVSTENEGG